MASKTALVKAGALRALATSMLNHESKQCQLNSCATLYAISCAGKDVCKQLAEYKPLDRLRTLVTPGHSPTPQDDQLQLFAALLIVNLLHVKGIANRDEKAALFRSLQRAFDDAKESQVRETISVGLRKLQASSSGGGSMLGSIGGSLKRLSLGGGKSKAPPQSQYAGGGGGGGGGYGGQGFGNQPAPAPAKKSGMFSRKGKSAYKGSDHADWQ